MKKNDDSFQHRRQNKNLLMVHLIFVTKYRKKLLYGDLKEDIKQWIFDTSVKNHWYVKRMETDRDHIHILLQYNPADSVREIVAKLKQYSTFYAWKNMMLYFRDVTGKSILYGQMDTLQHLSDRYLRKQLNITSKLRDSKTDTKGSLLL